MIRWQFGQLRNRGDAGGKEDGEDRTGLADGAGLEAQPAGVAAHNIVADPQAKPGARVALSGHERLEDVLFDGFGNATAGVGHNHTNAARHFPPVESRPAIDVNLAARRSGIDGIAD